MIGQRKQWLQADRDRKFLLVVDESHPYRGTSGLEVAYLLRLLLYRWDCRRTRNNGKFWPPVPDWRRAGRVAGFRGSSLGASAAR